MLLARLAASSSSASNGSAGFSLEAYAGKIATAVAVQDATALSKLFSLKDNEHIDGLLASLPRPTRQYINSGNDTPHLQDFKRLLANVEFGRQGPPTWTTMASKHLAALLHLKHNSSVQSDDIDVDDEAVPSWDGVFTAQQDLVKCVYLSCTKLALLTSSCLQNLPIMVLGRVTGSCSLESARAIRDLPRAQDRGNQGVGFAHDMLHC